MKLTKKRMNHCQSRTRNTPSRPSSTCINHEGSGFAKAKKNSERRRASKENDWSLHRQTELARIFSTRKKIAITDSRRCAKSWKRGARRCQGLGKEGQILHSNKPSQRKKKRKKRARGKSERLSADREETPKDSRDEGRRRHFRHKNHLLSS